MHKTTCKPCDIWVVDKLTTLHESQQWRKLIKWRTFVDEDVFPRMRGANTQRMNLNMAKLQFMFTNAYKLGITATDDLEKAYALAAISLLLEMVELYRKTNQLASQGSVLCDLGHMHYRVHGNNDKAFVEYYKQADELAKKHDLKDVQARVCMGMGSSARDCGRYRDAAQLFRDALDKVATVNSQYEICCSHQLIEVLFELNSIDEAKTLIDKYPHQIEQATGPLFKGLTPFHLNYHLHLARVFNARGETVYVEQQLRQIISLVIENKSSIHDWRPVFLSFLKECSKRIKLLHPKTGKKRLVKAFADLTRVKA